MGKLREGNQFILQINGSLLLPLNMELVCISFSQLGIHMTCKLIHFHESCHSFDSFKRMHCPLSHCVFVLFGHAAKYFCHVTRCSKGIWRSFTSAVYIVFMSLYLSQSYGYYIHIIPELCFEFHVIDVGLIMALLWRDFSRRHQLIIQEIVLETKT